MLFICNIPMISEGLFHIYTLILKIYEEKYYDNLIDYFTFLLIITLTSACNCSNIACEIIGTQ